MGLAGRGFGSVAEGGAADFVLFRGRRFSEILARPQFDRVRRCYRQAECFFLLAWLPYRRKWRHPEQLQRPQPTVH